jgi:hypothetical protein
MGGGVVSVTPRPRFTPGTHCTGGWVGPRAGLDTEDRGKIICSCRGSNLDMLTNKMSNSIDEKVTHVLMSPSPGKLWSERRLNVAVTICL